MKIRSILTVVLAATMAGSVALANDGATASDNTKDLGYAMGFHAGTQLKPYKSDIDINAYKEGLVAGANGAQPKVSNEKMHQAIQAFRDHLILIQQNDIHAAVQLNQKRSNAFLEKNKTKKAKLTKKKKTSTSHHDPLCFPKLFLKATQQVLLVVL